MLDNGTDHFALVQHWLGAMQSYSADIKSAQFFKIPQLPRFEDIRKWYKN